MTYVQWAARMSRPTKDGTAQRVHLQAAANRGSVNAIAALTPPPFPLGCTHLFNWWAELHNARGEGMNGIAPITYRDLDAWARVTGRAPEPFEFDLLLTMDATYRAAMVN